MRQSFNQHHPMRKLFHSILLIGSAVSCPAVTTVDTTNRYAYGANIGWCDWRPNPADGVSIDPFLCRGYIFSANVGWIHLGNGTPPTGKYSNTSGSDYGVNHDGFGNLRGLAWGANIGWVSFETTGAPKLDLFTGQLSGCVWGANVGWICLSNAVASVQSKLGPALDTDGDSIPDAFEMQHAGNLATMDATSDCDHDGQSDASEYYAGTNPVNSSSNLRITAIDPNVDGTKTILTWTSVPNRLYSIEERPAFGANLPWSMSPLGPGLVIPDAGLTTTRTNLDSAAPTRLFRVKPLLPLQP